MFLRQLCSMLQTMLQTLPQHYAEEVLRTLNIIAPLVRKWLNVHFKGRLEYVKTNRVSSSYETLHCTKS